MTKDLSRQLCELAGIEASKKKCNDCADGGCNGQISNEYIKQECLIYPNFELPENFVKLLECFYSVFVIDTERFDKDKSFVKNLIAEIVETFHGWDGTCPCYHLKQALQAQDWRY